MLVSDYRGTTFKRSVPPLLQIHWHNSWFYSLYCTFQSSTSQRPSPPQTALHSFYLVISFTQTLLPLLRSSSNGLNNETLCHHNHESWTTSLVAHSFLHTWRRQSLSPPFSIELLGQFLFLHILSETFNNKVAGNLIRINIKVLTLKKNPADEADRSCRNPQMMSGSQIKKARRI